MSLFIDVHDLPGPVSTEQAAQAHATDLQMQPEFGVFRRPHPAGKNALWRAWCSRLPLP